MGRIAVILGCFITLIKPDIKGQVIGPEQDCNGALRICNGVFMVTGYYNGTGLLNDVNGYTSCMENDEKNNSMWFKLEIEKAGVIEFTLRPLTCGVSGSDYDFAIYNLTGLSCWHIPAGLAGEVRCNNVYTNCETGLRSGWLAVTGGATSSSDSLMAPLQVDSGEVFALMINNYSTSDATGFTLDFSGTTAGIKNAPYPAADFNYQINGTSVSFNETSLDGNLWTWDMGDGDTLHGALVTHEYQEAGVYKVCLITSNYCFTDTLCKSVGIGMVGMPVANEEQISIYPNPATTNLLLDMKGYADHEWQLNISDPLGRLCYQKVLSQQADPILIADLSLPTGVYLVNLTGNKTSFSRKLMIFN